MTIKVSVSRVLRSLCFLVACRVVVAAVGWVRCAGAGGVGGGAALMSRTVANVCDRLGTRGVRDVVGPGRASSREKAALRSLRSRVEGTDTQTQSYYRLPIAKKLVGVGHMSTTDVIIVIMNVCMKVTIQ